MVDRLFEVYDYDKGFSEFEIELLKIERRKRNFNNRVNRRRINIFILYQLPQR